MGVLGTIVGFYFGTASNGDPQLEVCEVRLVEEDGEAELLGSISGGTPPYRYTAPFEGEGIEPIEENVTVDGWIVEHLTAMPETATVEVIDRDDRKAAGRNLSNEFISHLLFRSVRGLPSFFP